MQDDITDTLEKKKQLFRDIAGDESIPTKIRERYGKRILSRIDERKENKSRTVNIGHDEKSDRG